MKLKRFKSILNVTVFFVIMSTSIIFAAEDYEYPFRNPNLPVEQRVEDLLSRMTLEEKATQMWNRGPGIKRLGVPPYGWHNEALHGVKGDGFTVFPQGIAMASTWNPDLIFKVTTAISDEARAKWPNMRRGANFWSPNINLARDPRWGRTQETYGEDPYLTSRIAIAFIKGLQGDHPRYVKCVSTPKHFTANNEEWRRHKGSSNMSEKLLREYYLAHFKDCIIEGGAKAVMCAYNAVNGVPCCANRKLQQEILRDEWGFDGYIVSDCTAIDDFYLDHFFVENPKQAAAEAIKAGTDLNCGNTYKDYLADAVKEGYVTEEQVNVSLRRVLKARFEAGSFDPPEMNPYTKIPKSVIDCKEHRQLALEVAKQSMILLKNENNFLPFDKDKIEKLAVIGPNANIYQFGNYSGTPTKAVNPLEGIKNKVGDDIEILYSKGTGVLTDNTEPIPSKYLVPDNAEKGQHGLKAEYMNHRNLGRADTVMTRIDKQIDFDWAVGSPDEKVPADNFAVRWTGKIIPPKTGTYLLGIKADDGYRMYINGEQVIRKWDITDSQTVDTATYDFKKGKEYHVVVEYFDRSNNALISLMWDPDYEVGSEMKDAAEKAKQADKVILVLGLDCHNIEGEGKDLDEIELPEDQKRLAWKIYQANPNIAAVLVNGTALAVNWLDENVPAILEAWYSGEEGGTALADILFGDTNPGGKLPLTFYKSTSQLPPFYDYDITKGRTYMYLDEEPLYPFGYGLSYTTFSYDDIQLDKDQVSLSGQIKVSFKVKNTGSMQGDEIAQLYVKDLDAPEPRPIKELKAFKRISLEPGQQKTVQLTVKAEDLAKWDDCEKRFITSPGNFRVMIGSSSKDIKLTEKFKLVIGI